MLTTKNSTISQLPPPSWEGVRRIYKKLSEEFSVLTSAFNVTIDDQTKIHLDYLIIAIDEVDNCVDELPTKLQRDSVTNSLTDFLVNEELHWNHPDATKSLSEKIGKLKIVVKTAQIEEKFISAAKAIFHNTEVKRHTKDTAELIDFIIQEGNATARLPLSILGLSEDTPFGKFFAGLCMIMGIADLIFDARQDFRKGFISVKPTIGLYFKLFSITVVDGLKLLYRIPRKLRFISYCIRFGITMLRE